MTQAVTLRTPATEVQDAVGGVTYTYDTLETLMYLEPSDGREDEPDRDTPIGNWFGAGLASVDFQSWSQVLYGDKVLHIIAPPRLIWNPRTASVSHVELDLQEIDQPAEADVHVDAVATPGVVSGMGGV